MISKLPVLLSVFIGGGIGSVGRFLLSGSVQRSMGGIFPWGTLSVNVLGSLAIGMIWAAAGRHDLVPGDAGASAPPSIDVSGPGGGGAFAALTGLGHGVTGLDALMARVG